MSGLTAKRHHWLGLRPRPRWGSLQRSPDPLAGFQGPTSKRREGKGEGEGRGEAFLVMWSRMLSALNPPLVSPKSLLLKVNQFYCDQTPLIFDFYLSLKLPCITVIIICRII